MDVGSVVAKLVADTNQFDKPMSNAVQVIQRFNKAGEPTQTWVKVLATEMDKAGKKTDGFRVAMTRLSRDIKVAGTIFNTLEGSIRQAYEAASEGAKIMAAEEFFRNAGKSITEYRKATNGMVSDAELMKKANLADSMGIDEATFKKLVMVAEAAALKTGQSFDYMFNSIIVGTARSSRLLLDNLGIIVSVGNANKTYADKVNKTVEALSAEEKQLAFVEEVARKSQGTIDEYNKTVDRTAESFAKLDSNLQNVADNLKVAFAKAFATILPTLNKVLGEFLDLLRGADWDLAGEYAAVRFLQGFTALMAKGESFLPAGLLGKALGMDFTVMGKISREIGEYAQSITEKGKARRNATRQQDIWGASNNMEELQRRLGSDWQAAIQNYVDLGTAGIDEMTDKLIANFLRLNNKVDKMFGEWTKTKEPSSALVDGRGRRKTTEREEPNAVEMLMAALERRRELDQAGDTAPYFHEFVNLVKFFDRSTVKFGRSVDDQAAYQKDWIKRMDERLDDIVRFYAPAGQATQQVATGQGLFGPIINAMGDLSGGFTKLITGALSTLPSMGAAAGPLGAVLGALIPIVLALIDSLKPVQVLLGAISGGLAKLIENALGELLNALILLADPLGDLLAAIGLLLGSALRPFVGVMYLVLGVVGVVIEALAFLVTAISPLVEAFMWLISINSSLGLNLLSLFVPMEILIGSLTQAFEVAVDTMLRTAIAFNNGVVTLMRRLGLKGFGKKLSMRDFRSQTDEDANTDALNDNTQALRDLTREFRNLPQGYKAAGAIYAAQDPELRYRGPRNGIGMRDLSGLANQRWRT